MRLTGRQCQPIRRPLIPRSFSVSYYNLWLGKTDYSLRYDIRHQPHLFFPEVADCDNILIGTGIRDNLREDIGKGLQHLPVKGDLFLVGEEGEVEDAHLHEVQEEVGTEGEFRHEVAVNVRYLSQCCVVVYLREVNRYPQCRCCRSPSARAQQHHGEVFFAGDLSIQSPDQPRYLVLLLEGKIAVSRRINVDIAFDNLGNAAADKVSL